jgi:hypothetical protein
MVNTLKLDPFTRSMWGEYDAYVIGLLEALMYDPCYRPKLYVTPDSTSNNLFASTPGVPAGGQVEYGLSITPGSLIIGNYLPSTNPVNFVWRITDVSLDHRFWDDPLPSWFHSNAKGEFPNLWPRPYPVVGSGLFQCEFWNQTVNSDGVAIPAVIQVVLCVLEPCEP